MAEQHPAWTRQSWAFWRAHHEAWKRSDLNQRQYCAAEGIPLKAFGNWRAQFKAEPQPPERRLLYRRRRFPPRGSVADAIRYALTRWGALCCFLGDGRLELDTNTVERAIRPVALGRKNHLFAGSDGGAAQWATICSLITTAKLNNVEPFTYLRDVLERLSNGHAMSRIDDLLPWNWVPALTAAA
jgi:Transposase IS66 family/IS66 C-terminal element